MQSFSVQNGNNRELQLLNKCDHIRLHVIRTVGHHRIGIVLWWNRPVEESSCNSIVSAPHVQNLSFFLSFFFPLFFLLNQCPCIEMCL